MTVRRLVLALLFAFAATSAPPLQAAEFNANERKEVEKIVREYLVSNPEVLIEVMTALEEKRAAANQARVEKAMQAMKEAGDNPMTPVAGNPDGDVTVIEFFDYQCTYCKKVFPHLRTIMKGDDDLRVVMKEFPILGPASEVASRAALAVWKLAPEKYMDFHTALMSLKGRLSENKIMVTATELGVSEADLKKTMLSDEIEKEIQSSHALARELNITGTPAFIIGGRLFPGYLELADLKEQIAAARAHKN